MHLFFIVGHGTYLCQNLDKITSTRYVDQNGTFFMVHINISTLLKNYINYVTWFKIPILSYAILMCSLITVFLLFYHKMNSNFLGPFGTNTRTL